MRTFLLALAVLFASCSAVQAGTVTFSQPADCAVIAKWELYATPAGGTTATKVATILPTDLTAPCSETIDNVGNFSVTLSRGTYNWSLRAVATDGETADSNIVSARVPLSASNTKGINAKR